MADALVPRFVRAIAVHTSLGIDRVDEAVLVVEALARHCDDLLTGGSLELTARVVDGGLEVQAGPFAQGTPRRILDLDHGAGGSIGRLAATDVRAGRDGRERLLIAIG